jgi:hypothetical protein
LQEKSEMPLDRGSAAMDLFKFLFGCIDRSDQSYSDFPAESFQTIIFSR